MSEPPIGSQNLYFGDRPLSPARVSQIPGSGMLYSSASAGGSRGVPRTILVPVAPQGSEGVPSTQNYGSIARPTASASDKATTHDATHLALPPPRTEEERRAFESAAESSRFRWAKKHNSWALLQFAAILVASKIVALILLFWHLFTEHDYMLRCDGDFSMPVAYTCQWTKAFIRAFPLLALNASVAVAFRVLLQMRMYYTSLQLKGLLDFVDARMLHNPLFWALVISLAHGAVHVMLKIVYMVDETVSGKLHAAATISKSFILPALLFMALFYHSADIEKHLIPLSKYFEEDVEYSKRTLGHITAMDERAVYYDVWQRDVVGSTGVKQASLFQVVQNLIDNYGGAASQWLQKTPAQRGWSWFHGFWPGRILLDPRLGRDSITQQTVTVIKIALAATFLVFLISAGLGVFAIYRAYKINQNMGWKTQYILTYVVYGLHILYILYLFVRVRAGTRAASS